MEKVSYNVRKGLHSGDLYYIPTRMRYEGWMCLIIKVLEEPTSTIDEKGGTIWGFKEKHIKTLFYYKDIDGHFDVYKSKVENSIRDRAITPDSELYGFANNPYECGLENAVKIVFYDDSVSRNVGSELANMLQMSGMCDYIEVIDKKDMPHCEEPKSSLWRRRCKLATIIIACAGLSFLLPYMIIYFFAFLLSSISIFIYLIWNQDFGEMEYKTVRANMFKKVLGYDFGNDFTFLARGGHDHQEYLILLPNDTFERMRDYLDGIPDGAFNDMGNVCHNLDENIGFSISESNLNNGCGNTQRIEVDYKNRLLHYSFTIY